MHVLCLYVLCLYVFSPNPLSGTPAKGFDFLSYAKALPCKTIKSVICFTREGNSAIIVYASQCPRPLLLLQRKVDQAIHSNPIRLYCRPARIPERFV